MTVEDFNTIELTDLVKLPGIGKSTATRIYLYRQKYRFSSVKDLLKIKGLGKTTLEKLGFKVPTTKRKETRAQKVEKLTQYISGFSLTRKTPFNELPYNKQIEFYESLVQDTCHRPDLVRSKEGCIGCQYALLCNCHLKNFVSERNKRKPLPTKKVAKDMQDRIDRYYHYKNVDGSVNTAKLSTPIYD